MKNKVCILIWGVVYSTVVFAQDGAESDVEATFDRLPYEVVITPTIKRSDLRKLLVQVEEDFFDKFNELNIDESYDILCYRYLPTMSHIPERVCEPYFMINARAANVSEAVSQMMGPPGKSNRLGVALFDPRAMRSQVAHEYDVLQEKMEDLNKTDLEFRSIGSALATLKARLENFGKE